MNKSFFFLRVRLNTKEVERCGYGNVRELIEDGVLKTINIIFMQCVG